MLVCALGGQDFRIRADDPVIHAAAEAIFGGYGCATARWELTFTGLDPQAFTAVHGLVCERRTEAWRLQLGSELALTLDAAGARATVAKCDDFFGPGALQNVVRLCLALRGALLLHAAGCVHEGKAYLFAGKSGAGKSTLAKLFAKEQMLGDEIMCIDAAHVVHRAPFTGERLPPASPLQAPLGAIAVITQGPWSIERADVRALLPHVVNPTRDRAFTAALTDRVMALRAPIVRARLPYPTPKRLGRLLAMLRAYG